MNAMKFLIGGVLAFIVMAYSPSRGLALPILGSDLGTFAVLGGSTVTNTGDTTVTGNLGVDPGTSITGFPPGSVTGTIYSAGPVSGLAQSQLTRALTSLGSLGPGTTLSSANLTGLTLSPGVYTVPAGTTNLAGTLTLNGNGNANARWVFEMPSTLITSSNAIVNVIDTGAGASLYWDVGSSATLGTDTSFEGNILASTSITLDNGASIGCGRALASSGAVTMDANNVSTGCTGSQVAALAGSNGLSGGESVSTVDEPSAFFLFCVGLAGMVTFRKAFFSIA
jgi:hypothetical protein